ncbi:hypothetical protein [Thermococcus aciditolerans]|uniref:Uncharacterized protein n=1 Tax=Thermococcus aciditolerans TaxID=2598455 RepID=A0A5C0SKA5_9EURY|nr:hypothetical protein [Thermococcus aciditolerans]QEK14843.1 hypothetical protein FPV09_06760 [Thermococcus aciditolerans]
MAGLEVPLLYTFVILLNVILVWIRATKFFYYFHDWFATENLGGPDYMDSENWRAVLRGALLLAVPVILVIWLFNFVDDVIGIVGGFGVVVLYQLLLGAMVSDEIEKLRRERKDGWRYGWY